MFVNNIVLCIIEFVLRIKTDETNCNPIHRTHAVELARVRQLTNNKRLSTLLRNNKLSPRVPFVIQHKGLVIVA